MDKIIAIAGPTAVGKTKFAIDIAENFSGEIVSCDSMQLYKYMNIGSAKPTEEEQKRAVHHLIDFLNPWEEFSVARYQELAKTAIKEIFKRGRIPIISGGTGLYLNSLLYDMDFSSVPGDFSYRKQLEKMAEEEGSLYLHQMLKAQDLQAAEAIHPNNTKKIIRALERLKEGEGHIRQFRDATNATKDYDVLLIGLTRNRDELYDRINKRVDTLINKGLVNEVQALMDMGLTRENISMKGIGYKEIMDYLLGLCTLEDAIDTVKKNTRHYAKKQLTWFRRYDKMRWYNISDYKSEESTLEAIKEWVGTRV